MTFGSLRTCLGRAVGDLDAVVEHDDVVGDLHHHRHVVLDQQDRGGVVVADRQQQLVELGALARIEAGGRLVEAEQHRIGAHGARDLEPPLRAVGQVAGRIVGALESGRSCPASSAPSRSRRCSARAIDVGAEHAEQREAGRDASAGCAARPAGSPAPSCRGTGGCSGTCARRAPAASPGSPACARAGTARRRRARRLRVPLLGQRVELVPDRGVAVRSAMRPSVGL